MTIPISLAIQAADDAQEGSSGAAVTCMSCEERRDQNERDTLDLAAEPERTGIASTSITSARSVWRR